MTAATSPKDPLSLRRLAAEFAVIVIGVLVALGVDEARETRNDRVRERAYLEQLELDLATTAESLEGAIALEDGAIASADRVLNGLNADALPPADSMATWMLLATGSSATFHPTMGTVTALVEGGELRLLRDEELRRRVLRYHNAVTTALRIADGLAPHSWRTLERLGQDLSWPALLDPATAPRFPTDWRSLADDPAFHSALYDLRLSARNRAFALGTLVEPLEALEAQLARGGV